MLHKQFQNVSNRDKFKTLVTVKFGSFVSEVMLWMCVCMEGVTFGLDLNFGGLSLGLNCLDFCGLCLACVGLCFLSFEFVGHNFLVLIFSANEFLDLLPQCVHFIGHTSAHFVHSNGRQIGEQRSLNWGADFEMSHAVAGMTGMCDPTNVGRLRSAMVLQDWCFVALIIFLQLFEIVR